MMIFLSTVISGMFFPMDSMQITQTRYLQAFVKTYTHADLFRFWLMGYPQSSIPQ